MCTAHVLTAKCVCSMTMSKLVIMCRNLLSALHYMHKKGLVHQDLKVDNILLELDGSGARLGDFGSAEWVDTCLEYSM